MNNDLLVKLVGMVEMCGDTPPSPEQWLKFGEVINQAYAELAAEKLKGQDYINQYLNTPIGGWQRNKTYPLGAGGSGGYVGGSGGAGGSSGFAISVAQLQAKQDAASKAAQYMCQLDAMKQAKAAP